MGKEIVTSTYSLNASGGIVEFIGHMQNELKSAEEKLGGGTSFIDFDLSVAYKKNKEGKVDAKVLAFGENVEHEAIQKVRFRWDLPSSELKK